VFSNLLGILKRFVIFFMLLKKLFFLFFKFQLFPIGFQKKNSKNMVEKQIKTQNYKFSKMNKKENGYKTENTNIDCHQDEKDKEIVCNVKIQEYFQEFNKNEVILIFYYLRKN
jgi:predicted RND superfamily exporter protein